ncbi:uncharacterized protein LOC130636312 [Hydractinia symbiolongicarpus]|uniref:uncharacterized protein LOC130636312 n=1 Tax=Hydractinia symbiolongicarpus TaxID=13093 RepID=UPI00254DBA58|nr:uncharacterized protein LOC130636312 [Hydractinia symbiolongicarpus]
MTLPFTSKNRSKKFGCPTHFLVLNAFRFHFVTFRYVLITMDARSICFNLTCHKSNHGGGCRFDTNFQKMLDSYHIEEIFNKFIWNNENILMTSAKWATLEEFQILISKYECMDQVKQIIIREGGGIVVSALLNEDENVIKYMAEEIKILPTYSNRKSALGLAVEKNNIKAVAILYKHMKNYLENRGNEDKEIDSQLDSSFHQEEKEVGLFVKRYLKDYIYFEREERREQIAELLMHSVFFDEEDFKNVLVYTARYSPINTIFCVFDLIRDFFPNYFREKIKSLDSNEEDVLSIIAKYRLTNPNNVLRENINPNSEDIISIIEEYKLREIAITPEDFRELYKKYFYNKNVPRTNYTKKGSALYYLILHKQFELALFVLQKTNFKKCNSEQKNSFLKAIEELRWKLQDMHLENEQVRTSWGEALSVPLNDGTSKRKPKLIPSRQLREKKSMASNRKGQLLRQIATQLFYRWNNQKNKTLTEVQVMQVTNGIRLIIFVAFNPADNCIVKKIKEDTSKMQSVLKVVQTDYSIRYSTHRSNRYSKKLRKRLGNQPNKILSKVLSQTPVIVNSLDNFEYEWQNFYVLCLSNVADTKRHAEEILCDAASNLKEDFEPRDLTFSIYGKRRPCMSCLGRMRTAGIHHFNPNPGYFWYSSIGHQSEDCAKETLNILMTEVPHVTIENDEELLDYDTRSDSDSD